MEFLNRAKLFLVDATDLSKDALHVYVGLAIMLLVAILFRRSLADWRPLAAVALAAVAGEIWDLVDTIMDGRSPRFSLNWKDVWNTLFWPSLLFLLARFTRVLRR
jgi:cell shape-determining protein MreD